MLQLASMIGQVQLETNIIITLPTLFCTTFFFIIVL